jgi:hypothetical protein
MQRYGARIFGIEVLVDFEHQAFPARFGPERPVQGRQGVAADIHHGPENFRDFADCGVADGVA